MCTVLLSQGVNTIAVKYVISYYTISYHSISVALPTRYRGYIIIMLKVKVKVQQSHYRPGQALKVAGG
jgi:hypothetical protein